MTVTHMETDRSCTSSGTFFDICLEDVTLHLVGRDRVGSGGKLELVVDKRVDVLVRTSR